MDTVYFRLYNFTSERGYARLDQAREIDTEKYRFTHLSRKNEFFTMNFGAGHVTFNLKVRATKGSATK